MKIPGVTATPSRDLYGRAEESSVNFLRAACLIFLLGAVALAKEFPLVTTSSDKDERIETFAVEVDDSGKLTRLWQRTALKADRSYTLEQLKKGAVLRQEAGKEAIRFFSVKLDPRQGGTVRMDYLYSGLPPEQYKSVELELRKHDSEWSLFTKGDERSIKRLHFLTNVSSFLGMKKIIGIRAVQFRR